MNILLMLGLAAVCGIVCGIICSLILYGVFFEAIENIVRYLNSIRHEVSDALDELSGAEK